METGKQSSSDGSSAEKDNKSENSNEDNTGIGRSYECNFCKRGFTNAQALGGHMNIHRKDKAKAAKHKNQEEPSIHQKLTDESNVNSRYFPQIVDQVGNYGYMGASQVMNYQAFLPPSSPTTFQAPPFWRSEYYEDHDQMDHENLSLRIGPSPPVGRDRDLNAKENEVDLELRLGHDP